MTSSTRDDVRSITRVDAALDGGSCAAAMRTIVRPLWHRLRASGEQDCLWLEWPTARTRLTLHLRLRTGDDAPARAWLQQHARASGVTVTSLPPVADPFGHTLSPLDADARIVHHGFVCLARAAAVYLTDVGDTTDCTDVTGITSTTGAAGATKATDATVSTYADRQQLLLTLVQIAVQAFGAGRVQQQAYLAFHRDWLLRYPVLHRSHGRSKVQQLFDLLDAQVDRTLAAAGSAAWRADGDRSWTDARLTAWAAAVAELAAHLAPLAGDSRYQLDPFAEGPLFPVLFRVLHAVARQCGVALLDEAFLYHLLLRADGSDDGTTEYTLAPPLRYLPDAATVNEAPPPGSLEELYPWQRLIARSGEEGRQWIADYASSQRALGGAVEQALRLLREGQLGEGAALLARIETHRQAIAQAQPGIYHTLGRFYHGERAYFIYQTGDLSAAEHELDLAAESVARAIDLHVFLIPLAPLVVDIPLQKARLARGRRDWPAMDHHLRVMYEMEAGLRPLCVLRDGTPIGYDTIAARLGPASLPPAESAGTAADAPAGDLRVLHLANRLNDFRRMAGRLYLTPGLVCLDSPLPD